MYNFQLTEAREAIDSLSFDPMDVAHIISNLKDESETAQIIIFYSYLDDRIKSILSLQMRDLQSPTAQERVFGLSGPLNTFSSRILIAYHLGWLSGHQKRRLDAFRKIRNEFAHGAFKVTFADPHIASYRAAIDYSSTGIFERINKNVPTITIVPSVLANLIVLAMRTFEELLTLPVAKSYNVHPRDILYPIDKQPELVSRVLKALIACLLDTGVRQSDTPPDDTTISTSMTR